MVRVLLFGRLSDIAGWREREVALDGRDVTALRAELSRQDPGLGLALAGAGVQVAVDKAITRQDAALRAGAEVAFLPPMSGG